MKAPSVQAPTSKEAPMSKHRTFTKPFWNLELGYSLELGAWTLGAFAIHILPPRAEPATSAVSLLSCARAALSTVGSEGTSDNSPAFQRRVRVWIPISPEGTAERIPVRRVSRPFGTWTAAHPPHSLTDL